MSAAFESIVEQHRRYIGGSNTAAACGMSRYKTAWELFMEMSGKIERPKSEAAHFRMGRLLEPVVRQIYSDDKGMQVLQPRTLHHPEHDWMIANVDGIAVNQAEGTTRVWEGKSCAVPNWEEWGDEETDSIPVEYLMQCQKYMLVSGLNHCDLSVITQRFTVRHYTLSADSELHGMIVEIEREFIARVRADDPPPLEYTHRTAIEALKKVYRGTNGLRIVASPDLETVRSALAKAQEEAKAAAAVISEHKARLMAAMGENAVLAFSDGKAYRRALIEKDAYQVQPSSYIDFRQVNDPEGQLATKSRKRK